jgi:hypothetical protein
VTSRPERIAATVEHGCVTLAGATTTVERGRVVRAVARVRGVDSVVDLLQEQNDVAPRAPEPHRHIRAVRAGWPSALRLMAVGAGAGLAIAGLRLRGVVGAPLALAGALLAARGATDVRLELAPA